LEGQLPYVPASIPESIPSLIPPGPFITIDANGNQITISWSLRPGFLLQESTNLLNWQFTANPTNPYTISAPTGRKYYRLTE
jgi:hypothetical protein